MVRSSSFKTLTTTVLVMGDAALMTLETVFAVRHKALNAAWIPNVPQGFLVWKVFVATASVTLPASHV
jgi:hypothetical protein